MAKTVMKKLREEVEHKRLKLSVTEKGKEGKSKMIASCGFLEDELRQCSKEGGVTMADSVETLGVDLRTRVKRLGAQEKSRRKKCKVRFSLIKKNKPVQKSYIKVSGEKIVTSGYGASGSTCSGDGSYRKTKIEEADGGSSGKRARPLCPC